MSWSDWPSGRMERLPDDWQLRRVRVLRAAGYRCQMRDAIGVRCGSPANQVDHIVRGDDHRLSNLQALCRACHATKTAHEAAEARRVRRSVEPEDHPGLLSP